MFYILINDKYFQWILIYLNRILNQKLISKIYVYISIQIGTVVLIMCIDK